MIGTQRHPLHICFWEERMIFAKKILGAAAAAAVASFGYAGAASADVRLQAGRDRTVRRLVRGG